ncbi:MAG: Uma2 family endonuclease [Chloroflexi bacterium]|nr:Uma2 family endonuclease [Chloroflexota bacterium]
MTILDLPRRTKIVAGNLLFYYEEGEPSASVAPDVFVVKGVPKVDRRTYKLWVEKRAPAVVFEFTSRSTRLEDTGNKKTLYAMLGVQEYFVCDPLEEYLTPPLQGFDLKRGDYVRMSPESDGALVSRELGLRLKLENHSLRLIDVKTGEALLTPAEAMEKARNAESEVEHLREELKKLRG